MRTFRAIALLSLCTLVARAQTLTLPRYLERIREQHPFFRKENLSVEVERKRQERFLGDRDWTLTATPSYTYDETAEVGFGTPEKFNNARFEAGLGRNIWETGGRLALSYDYDYLDQETEAGTIALPSGDSLDLAGPEVFYRNAVSLSYAQPLLQNRGGNLDRLDYDLQGLTADQANLAARENQEDFLLGLGLRFLDWVLLTEQSAIAQRRLDLANEELAQTQRKLDANLVEKVDLLRARDAVFATEQALKRVESQQQAVQAELATQAQDPALLALMPSHDLYARRELPAVETAVAAVLRGARVLHVFDVRLEQLAREQAGLGDAEKARLDLVLFGGLKDGDEEVSEATGFDRPNAGVVLAYTYPLGNTTARADLERVRLEIRRAEEGRAGAALDLEAGVRAVLTEIKRLEPVLDLNVQQTRTAADKTEEEAHLYEQGRNQLTFVIQSRDDEALAQLRYAENAAQYHRLVLRYRALTDELLSEAGAPPLDAPALSATAGP